MMWASFLKCLIVVSKETKDSLRAWVWKIQEHQVTILTIANMDRKIKLFNPKSPTTGGKNNLIKSENDRFLSAKANKDRTSVNRHALADLEINKNISIVQTEKKGKASSMEDKSFSEMTKTRRHMLKDDEHANFCGNRIAVTPKDDRAKTSNIVVIEEKFSEQNRNPQEFPDVNSVSKAISKWNALAKGDVSDKRLKTGNLMKIKSPRALNIERSNLSLIKEENVPPKAISDSMKNLMAKIGDMKIYSPMNPPPLFKKKNKIEETTVDSNDDEYIADCVTLPSVSRDDTCKKSSNPTISINTEEATTSFDNLPPVETLSNVMTKTRARIPAKRRSQSREARKRELLCCISPKKKNKECEKDDWK